MGGCAAGSPAIVGPTPAEEESAAAVILAPETPVASVEPTVVGEPTAAPPAVIDDPAPAADAGAAPAMAKLAEPAVGSATAGTVAFAQDVPAVAAEREAAPDASVQETDGVAADPAVQAGRLAPPPAPGDGTILNYYRGPSGRLEVALTFDAGADRGYAAQILDELAAEGVLATFGMTGRWAQENPDLIQRMVAEGHQLINHTWSHGSLTGASTGGDPITYEALLTELTDTEILIRDLTNGYELKPYFRPPYGDIGPMTSGYLAQAGYYVNVLWSCDSFGWSGFGADEIVQRCTSPEMGGPGAIILMHVGADAVGDFEALPGLIGYYRGQGYAFVTIEQMLQP
jgi:peptidoglycan-N-acetylglucosamine deacetylase